MARQMRHSRAVATCTLANRGGAVTTAARPSRPTKQDRSHCDQPVWPCDPATLDCMSTFFAGGSSGFSGSSSDEDDSSTDGACASPPFAITESRPFIPTQAASILACLNAPVHSTVYRGEGQTRLAAASRHAGTLPTHRPTTREQEGEASRRTGMTRAMNNYDGSTPRRNGNHTDMDVNKKLVDLYIEIEQHTVNHRRTQRHTSTPMHTHILTHTYTHRNIHTSSATE